LSKKIFKQDPDFDKVKEGRMEQHWSRSADDFVKRQAYVVGFSGAEAKLLGTTTKSIFF